MDMQNTAEIVSWFNVAPPDVEMQIFARLPVEYVYRYRLVCKQWNDLLSSNDFLSMWAEVSLTRKQPRLVLCGDGPEMPWMTFFFYTRTWINSCFTLSFMEDWTGIPCRFYCHQSIPGLILATGENSLDGRICNPYTKAFVDIPALNYGFNVLDKINNSDSSYRVVVVNLIGPRMVQIYEPSRKRWNIVGDISDDFRVYDKPVSYDGTFYVHCRSIGDDTHGIGVFTIPDEADGSDMPTNPIPILFAPFPEILLNWIRAPQSWPHIITCGSRVLLVAAKQRDVELEQAGGEGEGKKPEIMIWEFMTEGQGHPSNLPSWKWVEIARMPSSMCEKCMHESEDYWMRFIGVGDYVCFVKLTREIVDVATYNLINKRWAWLPSVSKSGEESGLFDSMSKAMAFVPNPHAKVE